MNYHRSSSVGSAGNNVVTPAMSRLGRSSSDTMTTSTTTIMPATFHARMQSSMTIDEMRALHQQAAQQAEHKRTELRLVLASRYRELVGSSDEVLRMQERAQELHELVHALPTLMEKAALSSGTNDGGETNVAEEEKDSFDWPRWQRLVLSELPRQMHRALQQQDVYDATRTWMQFMQMLPAEGSFPVAKSLAGKDGNASSGTQLAQPISPMDENIHYRVHLLYLHMESMPHRIRRLCTAQLQQQSTVAVADAMALASLHYLLAVHGDGLHRDGATHLLDAYWDAKAAVLQSLLQQLDDNNDGQLPTDQAEHVLSSIVLLLQRDVIMHPYQIFCLRSFDVPRMTSSTNMSALDIMDTLPLFDTAAVAAKCTHVLQTYLPLIRSRVQTILVHIAGTTASALGQMRQVLYDGTDGAEAQAQLQQDGTCRWQDAARTLVKDAKVLPKYSLWNALFSNTFTSLVHSLLTTSFQSVHASVIASLQSSLQAAPTLDDMLPHEAHANMAHIVRQLDAALRKVAADAHQLLVHAEERDESVVRLRQSLYVQACEIMGRLVCELRRMVGSNDDATKEYMVARICFLLKFRLSMLPELLDPAAMGNTSGRISLLELRSAFDLADHDGDGLIRLDQAMEAVDSAFAGTSFAGAHVVRETLLLDETKSDAVPHNISLNELALLTARGLRHDPNGAESALGTVQRSLDDIVQTCLMQWATRSLHDISVRFSSSNAVLVQAAKTLSTGEWRRTHAVDGRVLETVSPHVVAFALDVAAVLQAATCPSDTRSPVLSVEIAGSMGMLSSTVPDTFMATMEKVLLQEALRVVHQSLQSQISLEELAHANELALQQLYVDVYVLEKLFASTASSGGAATAAEEVFTREARQQLQEAKTSIHQALHTIGSATVARSLESAAKTRFQQAFSVTKLCLTARLSGDDETAASRGQDDASVVSANGSVFVATPLSSSRRFVLLPVQTDRSLADLRARKYGSDMEDDGKRGVARQDSYGTDHIRKGFSSVMSSSFGFFSKK